MRFVIYGAGGIGGAIGGRLHQAGHDVVLVARGDHLAALRERGLTLRSPAETVVLPVPAVARPAEAELGPGDVVVLAMKSQHTRGRRRPSWPAWRRRASPSPAPRTAWRTSAPRCGRSPTCTASR